MAIAIGVGRQRRTVDSNDVSRSRFLFLVILTVIFSVGCDQARLLAMFSSPEDQARAQGYVDKLRGRDFDAIENVVDPSLRSPSLHGTLVRMADQIPSGPTGSVKLVGAQVFRNGDRTVVNTTLEYNVGDRWFLANAAVQTKGQVKTLVGLNIYAEAQSLESLNRFRLSGKGPKHFAMLAAAVAAPLFTLYALLVCLKRRLPGRKWPWVLFIITGLGKVAINWTSGQLSIAPAAIQLFSVSAFAPFFGPWTIAVSLPVGAVVFLVWRKRQPASPAGLEQNDGPSGITRDTTRDSTSGSPETEAGEQRDQTSASVDQPRDLA